MSSQLLKLSDRDVKIEIVFGDITLQNVDVIVNAAHEALMGGGGVDGAIHRAAGQSLIQECREIEQVEHGVRCRIGEAHITSGGRLAAKYVIHTVAPKFVGSIVRTTKTIVNGKEIEVPNLNAWSLTNTIYKNAKEGTDEDLANCYDNCIRLASKYNLTSIAFPSLGTGGHAYPIELASKIALKSTYKALRKYGSVEEVRFVCFSQNDYNVYVDSMKNLYST